MSDIDITKLYVGQKIKNYKQMCSLLGQDEKIGNSRKSQIKEWERYMLWEQDGHKVIIKEIYSEPLEKKTKEGSNNAPYANQIQKLVLDLLLQDSNNGHILLSKFKLLQELNMINPNYAFSKRRIPKLSQFLNINEKDVNEFYESSSVTIVRNLESALNKLRSKAVIFWSKAIMLCTISINYQLNELGEPVAEKNFVGLDEYDEEIYNHKAQYSSVYNFRKASEDEVKMVLRIENEMLKDLGRNDKGEIIRYGEWERFSHGVNNELLKRMGVDFYYEGYEVVFNENHVQHEWERLSDILLMSPEEKKEQRKLLNSGVGDRIIYNSTKRHDKAIGEVEEAFGDIGDKNQRRSDKDYVDNNKKLVGNLINQNSRDIRGSVKRVKLVNKSKEK
jgi:hypothetical protein